MGAPLTDPAPLHSLLYPPQCSICLRPMYRHPIILWAVYCLGCDRG
jgi:hypothetical protein